jgi:hypothetical protein
MGIILLFGIFWAICGILSLFGIQYIPEQYKNKSWTKDYVRSRGICWLLFGLSDFVIYFVLSAFNVTWLVVAGLLIFCNIPPTVYSSNIDKKYQEKLESEHES